MVFADSPSNLRFVLCPACSWGSTDLQKQNLVGSVDYIEVESGKALICGIQACLYLYDRLQPVINLPHSGPAFNFSKSFCSGDFHTDLNLPH